MPENIGQLIKRWKELSNACFEMLKELPSEKDRKKAEKGWKDYGKIVEELVKCGKKYKKVMGLK